MGDIRRMQQTMSKADKPRKTMKAYYLKTMKVTASLRNKT